MNRSSDIGCQQVLLQDAAVFSMQQMDLPLSLAEDMGPEQLYELYLAHIRRFTLGIIRPTPVKGQVMFRLAGTRMSLLSFSGPMTAHTETGHSLSLAICGGLLVQPRSCDRGELVFSCEPRKDCLRLTLRLSDYCPLLLGSSSPSWWRKGLYRFTQATIHKAVTVRFFQRLYRTRAGKQACCRVVRANWREGENI